MKTISNLTGTVTESAEALPAVRFGIPVGNGKMTMDDNFIRVSNGKDAVKIAFSELEKLIVSVEPGLKSS
jgi:hypothetical protein